MTVKELKNLLERCPDDMKIVLASDEEGNRMEGVYIAEVLQFQKSNNDGSYDALTFYPDGREISEYDAESEE